MIAVATERIFYLFSVANIFKLHKLAIGKMLRNIFGLQKDSSILTSLTH